MKKKTTRERDRRVVVNLTKLYRCAQYKKEIDLLCENVDVWARIYAISIESIVENESWFYDNTSYSLLDDRQRRRDGNDPTLFDQSNFRLTRETCIPRTQRTMSGMESNDLVNRDVFITAIKVILLFHLRCEYDIIALLFLQKDIYILVQSCSLYSSLSHVHLMLVPYFWHPYTPPSAHSSLYNPVTLYEILEVGYNVVQSTFSKMSGEFMPPSG